MEQLAFLTEETVREIRRRFGTPVFVYDQEDVGGPAPERSLGLFRTRTD